MSCYDKLRNAVASTSTDPSKAAKIQNLSSRKISEILPNLYLSGRTVSQNSELLREKNVTTVINVSDREVVDYQINHPFVKTYKFYPLSDTADARFDEFFEEAVQIIHSARIKGEGVLVHCFLGVSRSATMIAFYLISALGLKSREAVDFIHRRRHASHPNFGFLHQLKVFSNTKAQDVHLRLIGDRCLELRQSDGHFIKKYLPLAVIEI